MKKLKVYLDTSVINFLYADDAPEFKKITKDFFDKFVKLKKYDTFISDVVVFEINKTQDIKKRNKLLKVIKDYYLRAMVIDEEAKNLANLYIKEKIIPKKKIEDARHIAICTINNVDILLSWNFKHIANVNKKFKVKRVNEREGYFHPLDLLTPIQLVYEKE